MFCLHRCKCNVEKVLSGHLNNIVVLFHSFYTDSMHVAAANLLSEIITVRDGFLSLLTWSSRDLIDDVMSSVCV